ncbi:MAG TPA: GntR family transcriptional regulator [Aquabacterium sp.]|uniref:GntR family transcriptional regulator n=1 Tax=Aquabacterium sp. TaxID=1872578 RepID=UPI002E3770DE|nr:GntR family transcriptional regulator [Aquabacterium sp.]HEX5358141.1 GntR family transcriptional regulator [Aquabacterium sp.]
MPNKSNTPDQLSSTSDAVERTTSATLSDEDIHRKIIEAIVDQRLLPGTKLVEDKLGQVFGVSRTRIRQVLIRLAQEQVVTILPNKGASIAEPSVEESREVFEARSVIEAVLVRRFIERARPADLKALAACIEAEEAARQAGDHAMALRHSGQFHLLLAQAAGHRTFEAFLRKLVSRTSLILMSYAPVERHRPPALGASPVRWVQACRCDEHRQLLTALKAAVKGKKPVDEAVDIMTTHLSHIEAGLCFNQPAASGSDPWASWDV